MHNEMTSKASPVVEAKWKDLYLADMYFLAEALVTGFISSF